MNKIAQKLQEHGYDTRLVEGLSGVEVAIFSDKKFVGAVVHKGDGVWAIEWEDM